MGLVNPGAPRELISVLNKEKPISYFVELGTFKGATALWASQHFPSVVTVEASESLYREARARLAGAGNVDLRLGDSRAVLPAITAALDGPALFWLDSHWSGGDTFGADDQCPVLDEVKAILGAGHDHVLLIDDARLFLSAPCYPLDPKQWPTISAIVAVIGRLRPDYEVCVIDDVIVAYPPPYHSVVVAYCQRRTTIMEWRLGAYLSFLDSPGPGHFLRLARVVTGVLLKRAGLWPELSDKVIREAPRRLRMSDH